MLGIFHDMQSLRFLCVCMSVAVLFQRQPHSSISESSIILMLKLMKLSFVSLILVCQTSLTHPFHILQQQQQQQQKLKFAVRRRPKAR